MSFKINPGDVIEVVSENCALPKGAQGEVVGYYGNDMLEIASEVVQFMFVYVHVGDVVKVIDGRVNNIAQAAMMLCGQMLRDVYAEAYIGLSLERKDAYEFVLTAEDAVADGESLRRTELVRFVVGEPVRVYMGKSGLYNRLATIAVRTWQVLDLQLTEYRDEQ